MSDLDLFIGVVTHRNTRFPQAQGLTGAAESIAQACRRAGLSVNVVVEYRDLWNESRGTLPAATRTLYQEELLEEWRWRGFLGQRSPRWLVSYLSRWLRNLFNWRGVDEEVATKRLLNIEMAHSSLWKQAITANAQVALILEDDAAVEDPDDVALGLASLIRSEWGFVNLSTSFTADQLGVSSLLSESQLDWAGRSRRKVLLSKLPITNTVCAIAYRHEFLSTLLSAWERLPLLPVLPIDWKMNRALRQMVEAGMIESKSSLWVEPGPLIQRSLHPTLHP